jgi:hypothetical protein
MIYRRNARPYSTDFESETDSQGAFRRLATGQFCCARGFFSRSLFVDFGMIDLGPAAFFDRCINLINPGAAVRHFREGIEQIARPRCRKTGIELYGKTLAIPIRSPTLARRVVSDARLRG